MLTAACVIFAFILGLGTRLVITHELLTDNAELRAENEWLRDEMEVGG